MLIRRSGVDSAGRGPARSISLRPSMAPISLLALLCPRRWLFGRRRNFGSFILLRRWWCDKRSLASWLTSQNQARRRLAVGLQVQRRGGCLRPPALELSFPLELSDLSGRFPDSNHNLLKPAMGPSRCRVSTNASEAAAFCVRLGHSQLSLAHSRVETWRVAEFYHYSWRKVEGHVMTAW